MRATAHLLQIPMYDSSRRGSLALEEVRAVFKYHEMIFQLIRRDLISRYKRSVLGVAWTMLNPLGTMLILTIVFSNIFHSIQGYPIYILSGLIAWTFFSQTTTSILSQNVWGGSLLHRIYLPRTAFSVAALGTGLVNILISLIPLFIIMLILGFPFSASIPFCLVSILILGIFTLGLGMLFSTISIFFPDVVEMYGVILTAWMYLTPIIYPAEILPESLRKILLTWNPMYYFIEMVRMPLYNGVIPPNSLIQTTILIALVTLFLGWFIFTWKANELTYRT